MALSEAAKQAIIEFQDPKEWWHRGHELFFELAQDLIDHGYTEDEAVEFLCLAYSCVANEYGD